MSRPDRFPLAVRIVGYDLPGSRCGDHADVHVGVQRGRDPEGLVPGDAPGAVFDLTVDVVDQPDGPDFRGPYVQGRRGARFLYLTWGEVPPGGEFAMFRRAKLFLADIDGGQLAAATSTGTRVEGRLALTDACGMPRCAAVRPPDIVWTAAPGPA